jgi:hypothetical protein
MKQNFVYFLKNVTDKETGQAPHWRFSIFKNNASHKI